MSLITRCPACATMFRVVPDQLRISDGWVRCGHCADVFDASAHLQPQGLAPSPSVQAPVMPPVEPPFEVAPPPSTAPTDNAYAPISEPAFAAAAAAAIEQQGLYQSPAPAWQPPAPEPPQPVFATEANIDPYFTSAAPLHTEQEVISAPMHRPALPDDAPVQSVPQAPEASEAIAASEAVEPPVAAAEKSPPAEEPTESTIEDMSFVRDARRKAFWRRGSVRAVASVACLLLLAVLVLQVAVHERDRVAVLEPRAQPWLNALCEPLGCKVAPLRQIESLVIEGSSFNKVRGNAYRLGLSLRNKSAMPLAMPGIELALTDSQDQPVLRRVLLPAELGAAAVIAPGAEWSASLPVSVAANGQAARIAGYRLLAFYP